MKLDSFESCKENQKTLLDEESILTNKWKKHNLCTFSLCMATHSPPPTNIICNVTIFLADNDLFFHKVKSSKELSIKKKVSHLVSYCSILK